MRCAICDKTITTPTTTLCARCIQRTNTNLNLVNDLTTQAQHWTTRHSTTRLVNVSSSTAPLSINILDAQLGHTALNILEDHEKAARHAINAAPYGLASAQRNTTTAAREALGTCIRWLTANLTRLNTTPAYAIEALDADTNDIVQTLHQLDPSNDEPKTIVRCPADHPTDDGNCNNRLALTDRNTNVTCTRCQTTWTLERLVHVALAVPNTEILFDGQWLIEWFGIRQATLNTWVKDKRIMKRGTLYTFPKFNQPNDLT
jgi:hypothetical protein